MQRHRPFTPAWAEAFRDVIETDSAYREAARQWTWPVSLVLAAAPEFGYPDSVAVELQLERGRCHAAAIKPAALAGTPFVLTAPYAAWKSIVRGEIDPVVAVTRGAIAVRGSLTTLMMHTRAAAALVACAQRVPTEFPDET